MAENEPFDEKLWQRVKRQDPNVSTELGLDELYLKLFACSKIYRRQNEQLRREAVISALTAVVEFLQDQGFPPLILDPVDRPMKALVGLDDNRIDPMFAQRLRAGTPTRSFADDYRTAILACLANLWIVAKEGQGLNYDNILREAARKMHGPWFKKVSLAQLKSDRTMLSQSSRDDRIFQIARDYRDWLMRESETLSAEEAFVKAIKHLNALPIFDLVWGTILKTPPVSPDATE